MSNVESLFDEYLRLERNRERAEIDSTLDQVGIFRGTKNIGYSLISNLISGRSLNMLIPHIDYVGDASLNACAFEHKGYDFIGINVGTPLIMFDLFNRVLSHPKLLPEVGDTSKETEPPMYYDSIDNLGNIDPNDKAFPRDSIRATHAKYLTITALNFLILHEFAHLRNGPVRLGNANKGVPFIMEIEENEGTFDSNISGLNRQTLEMDADTFAAKIQFEDVVSGVQSYRVKGIPAPVFYESEEKGLYHWYFAIYLMFRLFDRGHYSIDKLENRNYPPPTIRTFYIMSTIQTFWGGSFSDHKISDIMVQAMMDGVEALNSVFYNKPSDQSLTHRFIEAAKNHSSKIVHNWKNVEPLLKPFSRGPLSPVKAN